jgi:hypothetical protein
VPSSSPQEHRRRPDSWLIPATKRLPQMLKMKWTQNWKHCWMPLGPGPLIESKWESKVNERFPGLFQFRVDFHAMVEILDYEGEIERTMLGWVRAD